jgi:hypothetical protein
MHVSVCLSVIPLSLLGNISVMTFPRQRRIVGDVSYALRVVSRESRWSVFPRTLIKTFRVFRRDLCVVGEKYEKKKRGSGFSCATGGREGDVWEAVNWIHLDYEMPTSGSCELGDETLCFIKMGNFIISWGTDYFSRRFMLHRVVLIYILKT